MVDFIIIGAQKCGTTYLSNALAAHPEVCFCAVKEPFYFNCISEWEGVEEYHDLYDPEPGQICGEGSTHYTFVPIYPTTAQKIYEYNPDMKLIYLMREPFDRALSLYRFKRMRGETSRSFVEDVMSDPEYLHVGRYYTQLVPYLDHFNQDQVMPIIFEEFIDDTKGYLLRISNFLGVDKAFYKESDGKFGKNESKGRKYPPPKIRLIKKVLRPMKKLVGPRVEKFVKEQIYREQKSPYYEPKFRSKVMSSLRVEISQIEKHIMEREIPSWRRKQED